MSYNASPLIQASPYITYRYTSDVIDSLEKALQGTIIAAKLTSESELINIYTSTNNNKIFKYLKSIAKSDNIPLVMNLESLTPNTDHSITNLFNQYFHSVFHDSSSFPNIDDLPFIRDSLSSFTITAVDVLKLLFLWMLRSLLAWTKALLEYCRAVPKP